MLLKLIKIQFIEIAKGKDYAVQTCTGEIQWSFWVQFNSIIPGFTGFKLFGGNHLFLLFGER